MKYAFLVLLFWFGRLTAAFAQAGWPPVLSIRTDSAYFPFDTAHFQLLEDPSGRLTFDQIRQHTGFRTGPHFDANRQAHTGWLRMRVRNNRSTDLNLYYDNITGDYADIYWLDADHRWQHRHAGALAPQRELTDRNGYRSAERVFIPLKAGQETTLYQRSETVWWHAPPRYFYPQIETEEGWAKAVFRYFLVDGSWLKLWLNGIAVGVLLLAFGFNLIVYRSTKERVYLYFGLCLLFYVLDRNNANAQTALFSEHPYWFQFFASFFFLAFFIYFVQAIRRFVQPDASSERLSRAISVTLGLTALLYITQLILFWQKPILASHLDLVIEVIVRIVYALCLWLTYRQMRRHNIDAQFIFIAITPLAIWWLFTVIDKAFGLLFETSIAKGLPKSFEFAERICFAWMVIVFSAALINRYSLTRQQVAQQAIEKEQLEKERERERNRLIAEQNERLEYQVRERTTELQQSLETLKSTQSQLIQKEKLASLGELTAGIAHEIQNPLNFVNNFSEVSIELVEEINEERAKPDEDRDETLMTELMTDLQQNLQKISHHGQRASAIVRGMLEHSRASTGEKALTDLNALADGYLRLAYHGLRANDHRDPTGRFNCQLITDFDEALPLMAVVTQDLGRVLLNLYNNAFYSLQARSQHESTEHYQPTLWVRTQVVNGVAEIHIRDNGVGIPDEVMKKIFQPFFTTKPTGEGTGLGLSLSYDIITKGHEGELTVESHEGQGAEFVVRLPVN